MNEWAYEEINIEDYEGDNIFDLIDIERECKEESDTCPRCSAGCDYCLMLQR